MWPSEKPKLFHFLNSSAVKSLGLQALATISFSTLAIRWNPYKNHRVILVISWTLSMLHPLLNASITAPILLSVAILNQSISTLSGSCSNARSAIPSPSDSSALVSGLGCGAPCSSDAHALRNASSKHRPIAITSPVDFMEVPSVLSAVLNLSKGHLGILTTQ